jgi:hypothetical protein
VPGFVLCFANVAHLPRIERNKRRRRRRSLPSDPTNRFFLSFLLSKEGVLTHRLERNRRRRRGRRRRRVEGCLTHSAVSLAKALNQLVNTFVFVLPL